MPATSSIGNNNHYSLSSFQTGSPVARLVSNFSLSIMRKLSLREFNLSKVSSLETEKKISPPIQTQPLQICSAFSSMGSFSFLHN